MKRVLVASPVRQKPSILKEFLWSLDRLDKTGLEVDYAFVDDNEGGSDLLRQFAGGRDNTLVLAAGAPDFYHCDEYTHHWREDLIRKVAGFKDLLIEKAREGDFDFLFLVDSDLVLHPKTLVHLAGLGKDIVSEVFWTRWEPGMDPLPQVWLGGSYRLYHLRPGEKPGESEISRRTREFLEMIRQPGTYRVGGLGACTLISRKALCLGVCFKEIYNLDLWGEDRHFCVRAAALGLELHADTHYPPYHIYRDSDLPGLGDYKARHFPAEDPPPPKPPAPRPAAANPKRIKKGSRITLAMLVRNEAGRYLEAVLRHALQYIDSAVILDDASEDRTAEICREALMSVPLTLVSNQRPSFDNEIVLRKQLWDMAAAEDPDWILVLDADEMLEDRAAERLPVLAANPGAEAYSFRLYDMWGERHYREDPYWKAHHYPRVFMVRHIPGFHWHWRETPQHCGRLPLNVTSLKVVDSGLRIKHLGWMKPADRLAKYYRYKKMDPQGLYGIMEQYLSILDPRPTLLEWENGPEGRNSE